MLAEICRRGINFDGAWIFKIEETDDGKATLFSVTVWVRSTRGTVIIHIRVYDHRLGHKTSPDHNSSQRVWPGLFVSNLPSLALM